MDEFPLDGKSAVVLMESAVVLGSKNWKSGVDLKIKQEQWFHQLAFPKKELNAFKTSWDGKTGDQKMDWSIIPLSTKKQKMWSLW